LRKEILDSFPESSHYAFVQYNLMLKNSLAVVYKELNDSNLQQLRTINQVIFPIKYQVQELAYALLF
jgi:hypothetical protein